MDASSMSMSMSMSMSPSSTMSMPAATSGAMDMSMGGDTCKIAMTWNWYTVGACFISRTWQVTSSGMFAGSCIGVICLVISLEFLRRVQREYEAYIRRQDRKLLSGHFAESSAELQSSSESGDDSKGAAPRVTNRLINTSAKSQSISIPKAKLLQHQVIRSLLHMLQFGVAYFIMLLAMYYNGYIIICIIIGAFLGAFIFSWDQLLDSVKSDREAADVTGCCG